MHDIYFRRLTLVVVLGLFAMPAGAQSSAGSYRIESATVAGGGGSSSGGAFRLSGTFGQSATGASSGADYGFHGGFWAPVARLSSDLIFGNGFDS